MRQQSLVNPFIQPSNKKTNYYATLALTRPLNTKSPGRPYFKKFQKAMFLLNSRCSILPNSLHYFKIIKILNTKNYNNTAI